MRNYWKNLGKGLMPCMLKPQSTYQKSIRALMLFCIPLLIAVILVFNACTALMEDYLIENASLPVSSMLSQTDALVDQVELFASSFLRDANMKDLEYAMIDPEAYTPTQLLESYREIRNRMLSLVPISGANVYYMIFTAPGLTLSVNTPSSFSHDSRPSSCYTIWTHQYRTTSDGTVQGYFIKHFSQMAYTDASLDQHKNLIEVGISDRWLQEMFLSSNISSTHSMLYLDNGSFITPEGQKKINIPEDVLSAIVSQRKSSPSHIVTDDFLLSFQRCDVLDGYFVQYQNISQVFHPLTLVQTVFIAALVLVLLFAVVSTWYLYRNISLPFKELKQGFDEMGSGNYRFRIGNKHRNEFDEVMEKFNQMAGNIDRLINHVYQERLRTQEATFKQYQAQINPHFLYNCLFFIKNMAELEDYEAIEKISLHLAAYYRYITRVDESTTTLHDEITFVNSYLSIMSMRISRFSYQMDILPEMLSLPIPRLLIQPIVENAIVHGIEQSENKSAITITAFQAEEQYVIRIENSGASLPEEKLEQLRNLSVQTAPSKQGYGLWNLAQRLKLFFGEEASMDFAAGASSGLTVTIRFPVQYERKTNEYTISR